MSGKTTLLLLILFLLYCSCEIRHSHFDNRLDQALLIAGENRIELEKVLKLYSNSPQDSLKYKAACFLIENMPYYHYYEGEQLEQYKEYYEILALHDSLHPKFILDSIENKYGKFNLENLQIKYDIREIDSAYLCNNIEWSFKVWKEQPWGENISFEDFCEYILPYRIGNEKLLYWKEELYNKYIEVLKSNELYEEMTDPIVAATILTRFLAEKPSRFAIFAPPSYPSLGPFLSQYQAGSCQDITDFTIYCCRALGIPCHMDYMLMRGNDNSGHVWVSFKDAEGKLYVQDFLASIESVENTKVRKQNKLKVYRKRFSQNEDIITILSSFKNNYVPYELLFFSDVTSEYSNHFTERLTIPYAFPSREISSKELIYLCTSVRMGWYINDLGYVDKEGLKFRNINRGTVMRAAIWRNNELEYITPPFNLDTITSEIIYFNPTGNKTDLTLFTKIHLGHDDVFLDRMVKGVIEGSNCEDFNRKDTLHYIKNKPYRLLTTAFPEDKKKYKYVRYLSPVGAFCNIAELSFYENLDDSIPLKGKIIGTPEANNKYNSYENVFDGNTSTSFDHKYPDGGWVGLELEEEKKISRIVYTPRNRANYVKPGNLYELFYFGEKDWLSLGKQTAGSDSLFYQDVPEGVLFYLRNHTEGIEERIFTYENGKQVWW